MKRILIGLFLAAMLMAWMTAPPAKAGDKEDILRLASKNLKLTLGHSGDMLRESAILAVLDIKSTYPDLNMSEVIIPLMHILRNDRDPNLRILAALALYEVGDGRALWALREAVKFDSHRVVRHVCASMYNEAHM